MDISQVCSLRALPQPEQELALERHAISYPGFCGCVALRQKRILLDALINVLIIHERVLYQFSFLLCQIMKMFSRKYDLVVRAFACRRTNRGDNTVGSAVWRPARTAYGNRSFSIFLFDFALCSIFRIEFSSWRIFKTLTCISLMPSDVL